MDEIQYRHFRRNKELDHGGVISVGYLFNTSIDDNCISVEFAIAICSPKDAFCKEKARDVINQRFEDDRTIEFVFGGRNEKLIIPMIVLHYNAHTFEPKLYGIKGFNTYEEPVLPKHALKIPLEASHELRNILI